MNRHLFVLYFFLFCNSAFSENPICKNYSVKDGLPSQTVYCAIQDDEGFMWFGTDAGACRFDGKEFITFTVKDGLTDNEILGIHKDGQGRIWFLPLKGLLCFYEHGKFHNPENDTRLPNRNLNNGIFSYLEDSEHNLWFGGFTSQLVKIPEHGPPLFVDLLSEKYKISAGRVIFHEPEKNHMLIPEMEGINTYACNPFHKISIWKKCLMEVDYFVNPNGPFSSMVVSSKGIYELKGYELKLIADGASLKIPKNIARINLDSDHNLWLLTNDKSTYLLKRNGNTYLPAQTYFAGHNISSVFTDCEHNIWFCTPNNGVNMVGDNQKWISVIPVNKKEEKEQVLCVAGDHRGVVWFGTSEGNLYRYANHESSTIRLMQKPNEQITIYDLAFDRESNLFCASDHGPFRISPNQQIHKIKQEGFYEGRPGQSQYSCKYFCFDRNGKPYISHHFGVSEFKFEGMPLMMNLPRADLPNNRVYAMCFDFQNKLWFENFNHLFCFDGKQLRQFPQFDSLFENKISSIAETGDSALIIATSGRGLYFLKNGKIIFTFSEKDGLASNNCRRLFVDRDRIYVATNNGFSMFRYHQGKVEDLHSFNTNDGILSNDINDLFADENRIYLATAEGACIVDKAIQKTRTAPPAMKIYEVMQNDHIPLDTAHLSFPYSNSSFHVKYIALSFIQPEKIEYQYSLYGSSSWTETKNTSLHFLKLDPGEYQLLIRAKKFNSAWSIPAIIRFEVTPPFWQKNWFKIIFSLLVLGIVSLIIRRMSYRKMNRQLAILRQNEILENERKRISRDMHDDLGADLTNIVILSRIAKQSNDLKGKGATALEHIENASNDVINKMNEIVWALNPSNDSMDNLLGYLREYTFEFCEIHHLKSDFEMPSKFEGTGLKAVFRRSIFMILKESLNNIAKHAVATTVFIRIEINNAQRKFTMNIRNDGPMRQEHLPLREGNGLINMKKRAEEINGKITIAIHPETGTYILLEVPF